MLNSLAEKGKLVLNMLKPRKRPGLLYFIALGSLAVVFLFVIGPQAHAEGWTETYAKSALFGVIQAIAMGLTSLFMSVTVFFMRFVIEIASYNNYINSGAVTLGWVLVRDITNMFFVIILMLIAFGTVLGLEQYEWKKMLVKFVFAAILVNFSRVICGLIIDAAQVFMMTFISGVAATAGGNLVNALGLDKMLSISKSASAEAMGDTSNFVMATIAACIFAFTAMVVMGAYVIMLLARVIALWVLIILSPLAFVLGLVPRFATHATTWWTEFINNAISGPVLAFFLWLTFAVAGGGDIHSEFTDNSLYKIGDNASEVAAAAAMAGGESSNSLNEMMEADNLAGFIIAIALLMAGVKTTQKLAGAGAGVLGAAATAAKGFAMVATGVAAARYGAGALKTGAQKAGKWGAMKMPGIGGEAWKRRGQTVAELGKLGIGKIQTARDATAKKLGEKGVLGKIAGSFLETGWKKNQRVEALKGAVKDQEEIHKDTGGPGVTWQGKMAGGYKERAAIIHTEAEKSKRNALAKVRAKELDKMGRPEEAEAVLAADSAQDLKENLDKNAGLKESQLKVSATNLANERRKVMQEVANECGQKNISDPDEIRNLTDEKLNENKGVNERVRNLMLSAGQKGWSTFEAVMDNLNEGVYTGTTAGAGDYNRRYLSAATGRNAAGTDGVDLNESFNNGFAGKTDQEKEMARDAFLRNQSEVGLSMAIKEGSADPALLVSTGREVDANGRQRVKYGIGSDVGSLTGDGKARPAGTRANPVGVSEGLKKYVLPKISFSQAVNAEMLLSRDSAGNIVGTNDLNTEALFNKLKDVSTMQSARSLASSSLVEDMNEKAAKGEIDRALARDILWKLAVVQKANAGGFKIIAHRFEELANRAGIDISNSAQMDTWHTAAQTPAGPPP